MTGVVLAHFVGDYLLQPDWAAREKTSRWLPVLVHVALYTLPFLLVTRSVAAMVVVVGTHAVIDRYRLARYLVWAKNQIGPRRTRRPWAECRATGYPPETPVWLATWLLIIADNILHVLINIGAVTWL